MQLSTTSHQVFVGTLSQGSKYLVLQRDELRVRDPWDPGISDLNDRISDSIRSFKRDKWINKLESSMYQDSHSKFWLLIKSLSGKSSRPPPNQPIIFKNKDRPVTKAHDIARGFCFSRNSDCGVKAQPQLQNNLLRGTCYRKKNRKKYI
jgi:hypothetical protein